MPTSLKFWASTTLGNLRWRIEPSCSTCMYILMNHWIATARLAVIVSKIVQLVVIYIAFTLHARNVRFQRVVKSQMSTNWDDASRTIDSLFTERAWGWRRDASVHVLAFVLEADISSIHVRCKDDVTYYTFDKFWDNITASWICSYSMIH